ncbi:MAG: hypothetical protein EOM20_00030 [Spartobacteria bacterium]|nr:hypothetical protein [Spartobacteria bacterium]
MKATIDEEFTPLEHSVFDKIISGQLYGLNVEFGRSMSYVLFAIVMAILAYLNNRPVIMLVGYGAFILQIVIKMGADVEVRKGLIGILEKYENELMDKV